MKEIKVADELVRALTYPSMTLGKSLPVYAYWAPGDCTRYRVTLFTMQPTPGDEDRDIQMLLVQMNGKTIAIEQPRTSNGGPYTAALFLQKFGESHAGWWAGVRPILAALHWTPPGLRDTAYSPHDASDIGRLLPH